MQATACLTQFLVAIAAVLVCLKSSQAIGVADLNNPVEQVKYIVEQPFVMNMSSTREIATLVVVNKSIIPKRGADVIGVTFKTRTITPQFNVLSLDSSYVKFAVSRKKLVESDYKLFGPVKLHANYIGRASLQPVSVDFTDLNTRKVISYPVPDNVNQLIVTIVQHEGVWGIIFVVSVSILIIISYINLGAQLDENNMRMMIKKPKTLILGTIISIVVMPLITWFVSHYFFGSQPLFRRGSFIYAAGPAASASTLWTVMLNSDKELSVGLQVISTISALFTMPLFLYLMDKSLNIDTLQPSMDHHHLKVPYAKLFQTLLVLLVALLVGWRLGRHKKANEISRKIFRPLVFFVLIFIIIFSSILYWHIYQMFDRNITLASFLITMGTYSIAGTLGYFINCDLDRGVAISITSAYKNSGIAFAVLLVTSEAPDTYIAFVPCLTQVVTTSVTLYIAYAIVTLIIHLRRCGQPAEIQATATLNETSLKRRNSASNSVGNLGGQVGSVKLANSGDDENDEFIAFNVTDIEPESLDASGSKQKATDSNEQVAVKIVVDAKTNNDETPYSSV